MGEWRLGNGGNFNSENKRITILRNYAFYKHYAATQLEILTFYRFLQTLRYSVAKIHLVIRNFISLLLTSYLLLQNFISFLVKLFILLMYLVVIRNFLSLLLTSYLLLQNFIYMDKSLEKLYGNKVRTRVCGICIDKKNRLLVVNMKGISSDLKQNLEQNKSFFAPVGGGIEVGETATDALQREFLEETGLEIEIDYFMCVYEYVKMPIHAVELFFAVRPVGGKLQTGFDPEQGENQIITSVEYIDYSQLLKLPSEERHGIFNYAASIENLKKLKGYLRAS